MYGLVLVAAMGAGDLAPEHFFRRNGCYGGCYGGVYGGLYGGCYGYCYGGWAGAGGYGGYGGGCYGGYGQGYYAGGWGAPYGCYGCCGGFYGAGFAPALPGAPAMPPAGEALRPPKEGGGTETNGAITPAEQKRWDDYVKSVEDADDRKARQAEWDDAKTAKERRDLLKKYTKVSDEESLGSAPADRARLVVGLPAGAKLFVDNKPIATPSGGRSFQTPPLEKGQLYYYEVRAEVVRDGKPVAETKRVIVQAGRVVPVDFRALGASTVATAKAR